MNKAQKIAGFTLIELILVIGLFTAISGILLINVARPKGIADVQTTQDLIYTTIKEAQNLAMVDRSNSFGVHFEADRFILFEGGAFNPADPNNLETRLNDNLIIQSTNLPSGGDNLIFLHGSGQVQNLNLGESASFSLKETNSQVSRDFVITSLGAVDVN